jgi:hypothetical protein
MYLVLSHRERKVMTTLKDEEIWAIAKKVADANNVSTRAILTTETTQFGIAGCECHFFDHSRDIIRIFQGRTVIGYGSLSSSSRLPMRARNASSWFILRSRVHPDTDRLLDQADALINNHTDETDLRRAVSAAYCGMCLVVYRSVDHKVLRARFC